MNAFAATPRTVLAVMLTVLAIVVLLYLLTPPARRLIVSSNLIWERVLQGSRRASDRWRWWLALLLAATIASCIVLAVLRPQSGHDAGGGRVVVVVDNAPTMAARTLDGASRFVHAVKRARALIRSFDPAMQVMVVDTQRQVGTPIFERREKALDALDELRIGHRPVPIVPLAVAAASAEKRFVITDGVLLGAAPAGFETVSVFEPVENLGITAFDIRPIPGKPERREAFVEIFNAGGSEKQTELVITGSGGQILSRKVSIAANSAMVQSVDLFAFDSGPVRAALTATGDGFAADDVAYDYLSSRPVVRVTLVSASDSFLRKSLAAQPRVRLTVVPPSRFADSGNADIYVFDGFVPQRAPSAPALIIGMRRSAWLPAKGRILDLPQIMGTGTPHPVLQNVSLRDLYVDKSHAIPLDHAGDLAVLLRAAGGEALAVTHDGARRWVLLGFDLADSNLGLLAGFPVFLGNVVNWLADEAAVVHAKPGTIALPLMQGRVIAMDGSDRPATVVAGRLHFEADEPGLYLVAAKDRQLRVAVSLADRHVTAINRSARPVAVESSPRAQGHEAGPNFALSELLLAVAAALLVLEWVTYNRRITV